MSGVQGAAGRLSLRLPASSANLGPGFDALALALALYLEIDAEAAEGFSIEASGLSAGVCGALEGNLLLESYRQVWASYADGAPQPLTLRVRNEIPLGMGCGSSSASRLAAVALASHFAGLGWSRGRMLDEAAALEHHPDNAAACCLGGFVAAGYAPGEEPFGGQQRMAAEDGTRRVRAVRLEPPAGWHALLVLPEQPLATTASRAVLPEQYRREAIVENLQNVALLVAAFAQGDGGLLAQATRDRLHQPFRAEVCPLLPRLLPLAGSGGVLSVTLSGAGAGVLLLLESEAVLPEVEARVRAAAAGMAGRDTSLAIAELLPCALALEPALLKYAP